MNILVIGGNGFIGSHLVDRLIQEGHHVRVFDNMSERYRKPLPNVDYRISHLEKIPDLYEAMLGIDIVFHLACSSVPSTSNVDTINDLKTNLIPSLNVLNISARLGIQKIVFFSSGGAVYGIQTNTPLNEEHSVRPVSSYGILKSTIESYLFLYYRTFGIKPLILRPSNSYGPRQGHFMAQGAISTFLRKIKMNESITIFGDGESTKDYIYISDLIDMCYDLSLSNEIGVFNIGSGEGTSLNEILLNITKVTGISPNIVYAEIQNSDVPNYVLDISKAFTVTGKYPSTSLEEGIRNTWDWLNLTN